MASKYKIKINKTTCIGCGTCSSLAEKTFEIGSDMKAEVKKGEWDEDKTILQAAQSCPVFAIELTENGKKVFPEN
ncbi:MAG: ferredoxin [Candidatus Dojkabacteria bacterium]|nr:ferredoxin [Candidatus Dojkabacteria bacterium]